MRKSNKFAALAAAAAFGVFGAHSANAAVVAAWSFEAIGTQAQPYNTAPATTGTGTATQLGMTNSYNFANGEGPGSVASGDVLASPGASTGAGSYGWRIRGNGNTANSGPGVANGWNSNAQVATQGAQFDASTAGYTGPITVSTDINVTAQATRNLAILYTLDDTATTPTWVPATLTSAGGGGSTIATGSGLNTINANYIQLGAGTGGWDNLITASISDPLAAGDANFAVEIVNASTGADDVNISGAALNNSSGNWRYDNVVISGTAVPEPASMGLLGLAGVALLKRRRNTTA